VTDNRRVALLLGLLVLVVFGPIVATDTAQPAARYNLTAALVEHRSVDLGPYRDHLGIDKATYRGRLRSDKAPGQPLLAVPVYMVGRAFGALPANRVRIHGDLGLWWNTLWSSMVPFAVLLALLFSACARFASRRVSIAVTLALGIGTMMLPYSVNLFGHSLAALFAFGSWLVLERSRASPHRAAIAGLLAGMAVLTEYETAIIVVVLVGYALVRERARIAWFLLGGTGPALVLAWYQWRAFGAPWHTTYFGGEIDTKVEYALPGARGFVDLFFADRGLWVGAPVALIALVAVAYLARRGTPSARTHAIVALAIVIPYFVLAAGWSGLALLEDSGPRYVIPVLPFLAVPLAVMWDRLWVPTVAAAIWGALTSIPAAFTYILVVTGQHPFPEMLRRAVRGDFQPTVWSMAFGRFGIVLYAVTFAAVAVALIRGLRTGGSDETVPVPAT
jgi:hypothetical protein